MNSQEISKPWVIKIDYESRLIMVIQTIIIGLYLRNASTILTVFNSSYKNVIATIIKSLILISFLFALSAIINKITAKFICTVFFLILGVLLHIFIFENNNSIFIQTVNTFFTTIFPGVICVYFIDDYTRLYDKLVSCSLFISVINIGVFFLLFLGYFSGDQTYSMGFSQALVLPTNILLSKIFGSDRRPIFYLLSIINILTILIFGSRGSIVAILFLLLILILKSNDNNKKKIVFVMLVVFLTVPTVLFYSDLLNFLIKFLGKLGISSHSLAMMSQSGFFSNNGRLEIWSVIWKEICSHPFRVRGINADQLMRTGYYQGSNYSHSLILELLFSFGIIFGTIIIIFFIINFIKTILSNIKDKSNMVKLLFMSVFFPICIWSGTLWTNMYCWLWIAVKKDEIL